jgi:hypothetical protein
MRPAMTSFQSNEEFFAVSRQQIERWCDQRRLRELALLLPGYTTFFGLTDNWARLYEALKATRAIGRKAFCAAEWELLREPQHSSLGHGTITHSVGTIGGCTMSARQIGPF